MPLPQPGKDEKQDEFMHRCMAVASEEFKHDQAVAVCLATWRRHKEGKGMPATALNTRTAHGELVRHVRTRSKAGTVAFGIRTAASVVHPAIAELGGGDRFASERKQAKRRLIIDGAVVSEKVTDLKALNSLLPKEAREEGAAFPEKTLLGFVNVVTTNSEDRERDVLETSGAMLARRMPLLWQHLHTLPVGKMVAVIEKSPTVLRVATALLDMNALTADCAILIEADALSISHGFRALEWEERKGPDGRKPSQLGEYGFRVTRYEMMEESLVSVPCNTEAEIELWSRGKLQSEEFKRHAAALRKSMPATASFPNGMNLTLNVSLDGHTVKAKAMPATNGRALPGTNKQIKTLTKGYGGLYLDGSWESIQQDLCEGAWAALSAAAVPQIEMRRCWLVGTFGDEAIIAADLMYYGNDNGQGQKYDQCLYYRVPWTMGADGEAEFSGAPVETELSITAKAFAQRQIAMPEKAAVPFKSTPASKSSSWDAAAAVRGLRKWAGVMAKDAPASAWNKYAQGFARVAGDGSKLTDFSYPHHAVEGGALKVNRKAVGLGIAAINGGRGGGKFESDGERKAVFAHLVKHLKQDFDVPDKDLPELKSADEQSEKFLESIGRESLMVITTGLLPEDFEASRDAGRRFLVEHACDRKALNEFVGVARELAK